MKKVIQISLTIIISAVIAFSCKKDKGNAPVLPPYATMHIDFSNFTSLKKSALADPGAKGTESSTWQFAATIAGVWNSLISSNIAIPLAAYDSASNYNAVYVSQNYWQWS